MRFTKTPSIRQALIAVILASLLVVGVGPLLFHSSAAQLPNRSITLSEPVVSVTTTYRFKFDILTPGALGSIRFQFCDNSPLEPDPCNPPSGMNVSSTGLVNESGETGFSVSGLSDANNIILTRAPAASSAGRVSYTISGITNPDTVGTYFARFETFATTDATGPNTDFGGIAFVMNTNVNINSTVPPYLLFCSGITISAYDCSTASGNYIDLGTLSSGSTKSAQTRFLVATNAALGYNVTINGTTMTSGTDTIPAIVTQDVSRPGTSQFGINLVNNSSPNVGINPSGPGSGSVNNNYNDTDRFRFVNGDQIARATSADEYKLYTVSYVVNVSNIQAPGTYVSTLTYICTATF